MTNDVGSDGHLRCRILKALEADIGISRKMAEPFVNAVLECFAGEYLYFPSKRRTYPLELIAEKLRAGATVKQVVREFDISRSKLYDLFPGGLPGRKKRQRQCSSCQELLAPKQAHQ
ncbi:hypothetical protein LN461_19040 [Xanthomonas arboricola]|uniref:hypothetical protein n=1 Tax=Xanthomonas arboricola TaxID=56448 RepID=UPI001E495EBC|nr:hypothetical protein [Xanthomonas arboricola]MCC8671432.1 hypothetical protein [Xanthomonas arboricola]